MKDLSIPFFLCELHFSLKKNIFKNYFFLPVEIFMLYILSLSTNTSILNASSLCLKTIYSSLNISFKC